MLELFITVAVINNKNMASSDNDFIVNSSNMNPSNDGNKRTSYKIITIELIVNIITIMVTVNCTNDINKN